jgi:hypothetical protein
VTSTTSAAPVWQARFVLKLLATSLCGSLAAIALVACDAHAQPSEKGAQTSAEVSVSDDPEPVVGAQFIPNPGFARGSRGWQAGGGRLEVERVGVGDSFGARLSSNRLRSVWLTTLPQEVVLADVGATYRASAWVRTSHPGQRAVLVVRESVDGQVTAVHRQPFVLRGQDWRFISVSVRPKTADRALNVRIQVPSQEPGDSFMVDNVRLRQVTEPTAGCTFSQRGIPSSHCGPLVGAAFNSNSDPTDWERELGRPLGIRRTYWGARHVTKAVRVAQADLAAHRLPWISFKVPYRWADMAAGKGDAWARDLAVRLSKLDGPVWLAFHHEPEGDGNIEDWKAMQERLAPIVRSAAPNVAYTVILMGWYQVSGDPRYSLEKVWPDTEIDVAGFDPYNWYGTMRPNGVIDTKDVDMKKFYFDPISRWAASKGIAWAVAETGYTDAAHAVGPGWLPRTLAGLSADHGIAMAYFNTPLNSKSTWTWALDSEGKKAAFAQTISGTAHLP